MIPRPSVFLPEPRVAVVIPIFRHSVLVTEAIESVLAQTADFEIRVVLVNDGCPHSETDLACQDYAIAYPHRITYLKKANGGLSEARNYGIRHALNAWSSVQAIYLLDADNRLRPQALARAWTLLEANPDMAWVYPNIDMFGNDWAGDYGGEYSLLIHTAMNTCEAGSLVRREVFEAGIEFDSGFRMGFEDWDFFLTAGTAGFRGMNLEHFGFRYRKRPESMLADSGRDEAMIQGAMRLKHKDLFHPTVQVVLEQSECPRFAIFTPDRTEVTLTVDPESGLTRSLSLADFDALYWRAKASPSRYHVPPYLVVMDSRVLDGLRRARVLHWALWMMEGMLSETDIAALTVTHSDDARLGYVVHAPANGRQLSAVASMIGPGLLEKVLKEQNAEWINTLAAETCKPRVSVAEVRLPIIQHAAWHLAGATAAFAFLSLVHQMRASPYRQATFVDWDWREVGIPLRATAHEIVRRHFGGCAAYPMLKERGRHIGFLLPLVEFGGVEKVALNMAQGFRAHGWTPHLFVLDASDAVISEDWLASFETISFLADNSFSTETASGASYYGSDVSAWAVSGAHGRALGLLYWLDVVVNCHGGPIAGVMGQLRRFGVKTVVSLHLSDLSPTQRPVGHTYLALAYEHAYDFFAPCSHQLADWCHALGVPEDKIIPVPNAPSFPVPESVLSRAQATRVERDHRCPLRVIYLGRLDRQKGIDRLADVIRLSKRQRLPIEWRVIGKAVFSQEAPQVPSEISEILERPLVTPEELAAAYEWADVLVLLSGYEGLPLTVLEAMRAGVVPVATDVGAVSEAVEHDVNGILLSLDQAVPQCLAALQSLAQDRTRLLRLSAGGFETMRGRDWAGATQTLSDALLKKVDQK